MGEILGESGCNKTFYTKWKSCGHKKYGPKRDLVTCFTPFGAAGDLRVKLASRPHAIYARSYQKSSKFTGGALERRSGFAEESQLFGGGGAAQNRVAVGVAADDDFVAQLEGQVVLTAQLGKQRYRLRMHQRGLAVHGGHVSKHTLLGQ